MRSEAQEKAYCMLLWWRKSSLVDVYRHQVQRAPDEMYW